MSLVTIIIQVGFTAVAGSCIYGFHTIICLDTNAIYKNVLFLLNTQV